VRHLPSKAFNLIKSQKALVVLALLFVAMCFASPYFLTASNLINILVQCSINGIMAFGMTFAIIGGEFDLSIGSTMALCGLVSVMLQPYLSIPMVLLLVVAVGGVVGLLNGFLIAHQKANAFIITIASGMLVKGIALTISDGSPVIGSNAAYSTIANGTILGIPHAVTLFFLLLIVAQWVLTRTAFGRNLYAVGGDATVAAYAGIKVRFYKWSIFVITAVTAALGGILLSSKLNTGSPIHGDSVPLTVISSVVIGGTALSGGEGSALRTVVGLLIFSVLDSALNLLNIYPYYQLGLKGLLVIVIVGFDCYARNRKKAVA